MQKKYSKILELIRVDSENQKVDPSLLKSVVDIMRPSFNADPSLADHNFAIFLHVLKANKELLTGFSIYLSKLLGQYDPVLLFTESGLMPSTGFLNGLVRKIKHKILPDFYDDDDLRHLISYIFSKKRDYKWIKNIKQKNIDEFVHLSGLVCEYVEDYRGNESFLNLVSAIQVLSHRVAALGTDAEITTKLPHLDKINSPFIKQNRLITLYIDNFDHKNDAEVPELEELIEILEQCDDQLESIYQNKSRFGIKLRQTQIAKQINQKIRRLKLFLRMMQQTDSQKFRSYAIDMMTIFITAENRKNSIRRHINEYLDLLIFEIVEHSARSGKHYVAINFREYLYFLRGSLQGGVIVAIFAGLKLLFYPMTMSPFAQAMVFSIIYAGAFIGIHQSHSILATKLPSFTASRLAECIDPNTDEDYSLNRLTDMIVVLFRTQFVAFLGNLLAAIPVAIGFAALWPYIFGAELGQFYKPDKLLSEINVLNTPTIIFAALAGIYLWLSGVITGYYENKLVYARVHQRVRKIAEDKPKYLAKALRRLANYLEVHLGQFVGNLSLGFFFGFTVLIGYIFGLWLDTRHIAFSSANFGFALWETGGKIQLNILINTLVALFVIGFVNFGVSFAMALFMAFKSRQIGFKDTRKLMLMIYRRFKKSPFSFFLPVK